MLKKLLVCWGKHMYCYNLLVTLLFIFTLYACFLRNLAVDWPELQRSKIKGDFVHFHCPLFQCIGQKNYYVVENGQYTVLETLYGSYTVRETLYQFILKIELFLRCFQNHLYLALNNTQILVLVFKSINELINRVFIELLKVNKNKNYQAVRNAGSVINKI